MGIVSRSNGNRTNKDVIEVIILSHETDLHLVTPWPLRDKVIEYLDPTEPVAEDTWDLLK